MSVISKFKDYLTRHKTKILVGGAIIAGSIFLTKIAQQKLIQWQEKETKEFLERNRKQSHFESLGRTCNQTISNLSSALTLLVIKVINTDDIIIELKNNPNDKVKLWNELKIAVFLKAALMIYTIVMLVITLKVQLSIIGGYLYKDPKSISTEMQEKYLSICQVLLKTGIEKLKDIMETEVKKCVGVVDLGKQMKLSDIEAVFWAIQTSMASHKLSPVEQIGTFILPDSLEDSNDIYSNLLRDTADFLESDEVKSLITHCVNRGFILLGDQIAEFYGQNSSVLIKQEPFMNPFDMKKPLAKLLPIINGLLSRQSFPQNLVQHLIASEKLQILSANVYESFL